MAPATLIAGLVTYIWPFVTTKGGYIVIGLVYGYVKSSLGCRSYPNPAIHLRVASGVFVSMLATPLMDMGETHDVGLRLGMFFTILALGALAGPPISGAINDTTGNFKAVGYYAGLFSTGQPAIQHKSNSQF